MSGFMTPGLTLKEKHLYNCAFALELYLTKDYKNSKYLLTQRRTNAIVANTDSLHDIYISINKYKKDNPQFGRSWKRRHHCSIENKRRA